MIKMLLVKLGIPAVVIGGALGGVGLAVGMGWVSDEVAFWLWPTVIAVILLAACVLVLLQGLHRWLWPLGTGFVVQTVGTLILLLSDVFGDNRWKPFWYTLAAMGLVLLVMAIVWIVSTVRARMLEKRMAEGAGGSEEDIARIRKDMLDALDLLRRAGRGRNAIYELPWFLVMGRPAAGKTVAIKNSELGLPVKRDWVKGVGGTYTADWFFTNEMIFLDTPGKWVTEGVTEDGQEHWRELMRLLRKYRGRQPLDGLIVVVPADDLLQLSDDELEEQAANIREVVDLIHSELQFRFPVYLLVSKSDLVEGFVDFFKLLPGRRRHEILGWSNEDPNDDEAPGLVEEGFSRVHRRLETIRTEMLARVQKRQQARRLFFFTEEFRGLEHPLSVFAEAFFQRGHFGEPPVFRGFYFTSGTQEGAPLSKAMAELARTLGVPSIKSEEAGEGESKRSYFLLELFRELMVGDQGLVGRTAGHWWRRRRATALGVFAPAGLAILLLLASVLSLVLNKGTYSRIRSDSPEVVTQVSEVFRRSDGLPRGDDIERALELTGKLDDWHTRLAGFSLVRGLGMRRPGPLAPGALELFREQFGRVVLRPTLEEAERLTVSADAATCPDRVDLLRSVVWLRTGRRAGYEQLAALDRIWGLDDPIYADQAARVRRELRRQYGHLKSYTPPEQADLLLPGFDVRSVARSIAEQCGNQTERSTLEMFRRFQSDCASPDSAAEITDCYGRLNEVLNARRLDVKAFSRQLGLLLADLQKLKGPDGIPEARIAEDYLREIDVSAPAEGGDRQASRAVKCLSVFDEVVLDKIEAYAIRDDLLEDCRDRLAAAGSLREKIVLRDKIISEYEASLADKKKQLEDEMSGFNLDCRGAIEDLGRLDLRALDNVAHAYYREACLPAAPKAAPPKTTTRRAPERVAAPPRPSFTWFDVPKRPGYTADAWGRKQDGWLVRWQSAEGAGPMQDQEQRTVRNEIRSYLRLHVNGWLDYLRKTSLEEKAFSSAWLKELSETGEYAKIIGRAAEAAKLRGLGEPPFEDVADALEPLEEVKKLDLAGYQKLLGEVGDDVERCEQGDDVFWQQYKAGVNEDERGNSLVRAYDWVSENAGPAVAEGALTDLLRRPLDEARAFVDSPNLVVKQWESVRALYDDGVAGKAPFAGTMSGVEPVEFENLKALLGGKTGAVARLRASAGQLSPDAAAWLEQAAQYSELFFERETDRPRAITLVVTVEPPVYEPPAVENKRRLEGATLYLGPGSFFNWASDGTDTTEIRFNPFGDDASQFAYVEGIIAEKTGLAIRAFKKWREGEAVTARVGSGEEAKAEGPLAPLRLIAAGLGESPERKLGYAVEVALKGKKEGQVQLDFSLSGKDAGPLLRLLERGLPPPPAEALGG